LEGVTTDGGWKRCGTVTALVWQIKSVSKLRVV